MNLQIHQPATGPNRTHRLAAARVLGAGVSGLLGVLAVEMPNGYFGAADTITPFGHSYAIALSTMAVLATVAYLRQSTTAGLLAPTIFAANIGVFVAPMASDPVVSGAVVVWNLFLFSAFLFPQLEYHSQEAKETNTANPLKRWLAINGAAARHVVTMALVAVVAVAGYDLGHTTATGFLTMALAVLAIAITTPFLVTLMRTRSLLAVLALMLAAGGVAFAGMPIAALSFFGSSLLIILGLLIARTSIFSDLVDYFFERPATLVLASFVALIAIGAVLLSFPAAAANGQPIAPIDAIFTSTSAACVTGLIVLDTPQDFTFFGQLVILLLIQIGGLNIMVLSIFATVLLGRNLGIKGERALGELLDLQASRSAFRLIQFIVITTLTLEAIGSVILAIAWRSRTTTWLEAAWHGLFHSVSAFCNAGFALETDSLVSFQGNPLVLLTIAGLITLGGIGFAVLASTWLRLSGHQRVGLAMQTRVVLVTSCALVVVGWIAVALGEWNAALAPLDTIDKLTNALFQSVTLRTAGFNSIDITNLGGGLVLIMITLMFVGASPGGTGGGIKTTTLAVLLSAIPSVASRRANVILFHRRIGLDTVFRSAVILVIAALVVLFGAVVLLATQPGSMESILFETVSAFGTVGLSLGATATLDGFGKAVIIGLMIVGRVGPLSAALFLGSRRPSRIGYPEANIMVG